MQPDAAVIDLLVQRIVEAVRPLRIILFGSAARGAMRPDSDIDVFVVMPEGTHPRQTARYLYRQMFGVPAAVDIVVATPSTLEKHRHSIGLVYRAALRDGREIYAA